MSSSRKNSNASRIIRCAVFALIVFSFLSSFSYAAAPELPARPPAYVVDLAGIIRDDARGQLNGYLRELEQKTTVQFVILTVRSLEGGSIEELSLRTAEKWKLGQKGKDNGVLLTVALKDRKYRFEIGYGLEEVLPDSLVGSIGRQYLIPEFRKGDYSTGIFNAALAIAGTIADHEGVRITGMPSFERRHPERDYGAGGIRISPLRAILLVALLIAVAVLFIRHPGLCLLFFMSGRGGGGWSGGGGFGGGGGGFGGGGGGGFGGGGASGDW